MKHRSSETELMDDLNLSSEKLTEALLDISKVNKLLGGNKITLNAVFHLIRKHKGKKHFTLVDVGCGDGAQLRELAVFLRKKQVNCSLIGVDINKKSLQLGRVLSKTYPEISFIHNDILELTKDTLQCDVILTTLTLHHFTNPEIRILVKQFHELCDLGIIVNDLHRNWLAYYLFKIFSAVFVKSSVAKNDGLVSIQRGFKKEELQNFSQELKFEQYSISWKWAFRYLWVITKKTR